jgi:hypothetical protein
MPDILSVILPELSFVMLFQAAGIAIFDRRLEVSLATIRHLGQATAVAGMVRALGRPIRVTTAARVQTPFCPRTWDSSGTRNLARRRIMLGGIAVPPPIIASSVACSFSSKLRLV